MCSTLGFNGDTGQPKNEIPKELIVVIDKIERPPLGKEFVGEYVITFIPKGYNVTFNPIANKNKNIVCSVKCEDVIDRLLGDKPHYTIEELRSEYNLNI